MTMRVGDVSSARQDALAPEEPGPCPISAVGPEGMLGDLGRQALSSRQTRNHGGHDEIEEEQTVAAAWPMGEGCAEGHAGQGAQALTELVHFSLQTPGGCLDAYAGQALLQTFRAEWTACFSSDRPFSALLTITWIRVLVFLLGIVTISIYPWADSYSDMQRLGMVLDKISLLRFTRVAQRNPDAGSGTLHLQSFGLLRGECSVAGQSNASLTVAANTAMVAFDTPVEGFDGWYFETSTEDASLDPIVYLVEGSADGTSWKPFFSSLQADECGCGLLSERPVGALAQMGPHREFPLARAYQTRFSLNTLECRGPMRLWWAGNTLAAVGLLAAPLVAGLSERAGNRWRLWHQMSGPVTMST